MDSSFEWIWSCWNTISLRVLSLSHESSMPRHLLQNLYEIRGRDGIFIHRLVLLFWIGEIELAKRSWEEESSHFFGDSLEDFLFRVVIGKDVHRGYSHPEFGLVNYYEMSEKCAFIMGTAQLSDLLKLNTHRGLSRGGYSPHLMRFSSLDRFVEAHKFDKNELERIATIVPKEYHEKIRLSLILLRSMNELTDMHELDADLYKYHGKFKAVGSNLENFLLQKLLKLTSARFETYAKAEDIRTVDSSSTLKRRKFYTVYTIFPKPSCVWLSTTYENPSLKEPICEKED